MPKPINSVAGIDIGQYSLKSVLMQRRGASRFAITHYGTHVPADPARTAEELCQQFKALFKDMGTKPKKCVISVSSPETLLRIIEQPETPPHLLRDALRLNGMALLNQDVKSYVIDCDVLDAQFTPGDNPNEPSKRKYIVGGLPRTSVQQVVEAADSAKLPIHAIQVGPVCVFNSFELAYPQIFKEEAFFLLDIGHAISTVMIGLKRSLMLTRTVDFGGRTLVQALTGLAGAGVNAVFEALDEEDEVLMEYTRVSLNNLAREISSSIGFFEAQQEITISRVFVTGGLAKSMGFLKLLSEELSLPCMPWAAAASCENALPANRRDDFTREVGDLNTACGAAMDALTAV